MPTPESLAEQFEEVEHAVHVPDPVITRADDPESSAMLADSVGLALLVLLDALEPAEPLAFVLHDVFGMTFDEIAPIVDPSPVACLQRASTSRRASLLRRSAFDRSIFPRRRAAQDRRSDRSERTQT